MYPSTYSDGRILPFFFFPSVSRGRLRLLVRGRRRKSCSSMYVASGGADLRLFLGENELEDIHRFKPI